MMKALKKMLCLLIALVLLLSSNSVYAIAPSSSSKLRSSDSAAQYIEDYAASFPGNNAKVTIKSSIPLKSFTSSKSYVLYLLQPYGFAIYDEISGVVEEMNLNDCNPYDLSVRADYYYGGPMNYISKTSTGYENVQTGIALTASDITYLTQVETETSQKRVATRGLPQTTNTRYMTSSNYFSQLLGEDFGTNTNGSCIAVACAITLGFYDIYVNNSFVADQYRIRNGTTESFHDYLLETLYIEGSYDFTFAVRQMNRYLLEREIDTHAARYTHGSVYNTWVRVVNNVYDNQPTIIAMSHATNSACPWNHAVVAYGYREELLGPEFVSGSYFVHTGWKNDGQNTVYGTSSFSYDWFANAMCFNNDPESDV